jgi:hypothetical protein
MQMQIWSHDLLGNNRTLFGFHSAIGDQGTTEARAVIKISKHHFFPTSPDRSRGFPLNNPEFIAHGASAVSDAAAGATVHRPPMMGVLAPHTVSFDREKARPQNSTVSV